MQKAAELFRDNQRVSVWNLEEHFIYNLKLSTLKEFWSPASFTSAAATCKLKCFERIPTRDVLTFRCPVEAVYDYVQQVK